MTSKNDLWRVRTRWSKEATFIVSAPTEAQARQLVDGKLKGGTLDIADAEHTTEYASVFKIHIATPQPGKERKPIPENATILMVEAASRQQSITEARMALREHNR